MELEVTNHEAKRIEHDLGDKKTLSEKTRKSIKLVLVTLLLLIINFGYLFGGAIMFQALEKTNEMEGCISAESDYNASRNATLQLLMDEAGKLDKYSTFTTQQKLDLQIGYQDKLRGFASTVLSTGHNSSRYCGHMYADPATDPLAFDGKWSFGGAVLFTLTVVTTIGYGTIAPATRWGRWACLAYGTVGIPLMLLCLASFGVILAKLFRLVYGSICCCGLCHRKKKNSLKSVKQENKAVFRTDASGKPIVDGQESETRTDDKEIGNAAVNDEKEEEEEEEEEEGLTVPLSIAMLVIGVTLLVGAAIFADWEGWEFVAASYYCFISLSTIGFGDLVPNGSFHIVDAQSVFRCFATIMYILIGMAVISMCFQLITDELTAKFQWLSERFSCCHKKKEVTGAESPTEAAVVNNEATDTK